MKRIWLWAACGVIAAGWISAVTAQVLQPIDPKRLADVNGKVMQFDNVATPVLAQPTRATPVVPMNDRFLPLSQTDQKVLSYPTLNQSIMPTRLVPVTNFESKRAAANDQRVPTSILSMGAAPISNRQIHAFTPTGQEELKDQLNKRFFW